MSDPFAPTNFSDNETTYESFSNPTQVLAPQGFSPVTDEETIEAVKQPTGVPEGFNTPQEQFIPDIERALKLSDNPERDRYKALSSVWLAERLGADPQAVMLDFEHYTNEYFGQTTLPQTAWGLISDDFKRGVGAVKLGHMGLGLMLGEPDIDQFKRIQAEIAKLPPVSDQDERWITRALGDVANFAPTMLSSLAAGFVGAKALGLLGPKGATLGFMAAGGFEAFTLAAGNINIDLATMEHPETGEPLYQYLFQRPDNQRLNPETGTMEPVMDMDELQRKFLNTSRAFATGGGVMSALIEIPQLAMLTGGAIITDIVGKELTAIATKAFADSVIRNAFSRFVVNYGVNVAAETLQEGIQESFEWWATELGKRNIAEKLELAGVEKEGIDVWLNHVKETFKTTSNAMLFMSIPGAARTSGAQAIYDKREALNSPDLDWEANAESMFMQTTDIARTENPTQEQTVEANRAIETNKMQKPIRVIEGPDGTTEVDPADASRLEAYEARGIENVPVEVIPWQAEMEENMTPAKLAQLNDFKQMNGAIIVPNNKTIESLVTQNPEIFEVTETGVKMYDIEKQMMVPIHSEAKAAIDESKLYDALGNLMENVNELPAEVKEGVEALIQRIEDAERSGDLYDLRKTLKDDNIFGDVHLQWFSENNPEALNELDKAISSIEQTAEDLVTERFQESPKFQDTVVQPLDVEKRDRYRALKDERTSMDRVAKTDTVVNRLAEIDAEMESLREFQEDEREETVKNAVNYGYGVSDKVLNQYKDRDWAENEIAHRKLLRSTDFLYEDALGFIADPEGFAAYVMNDWYWHGKEALYEEIKKTIPTDPAERVDFFEEIIDRSYYKTERNLESFVDAIQTDEGLLGWLGRVPYENLRASGLNKKMQFAVSSVNRSITPTPEMLDSIRTELTKNAGYWQPRFFEIGARKDPLVNAQWQAQRDYEYLASIKEAEADAQELIARADDRGVTLNFYVEEDRGIAFLGRIQTPKDKQGQGLATQTMEEVVEYADKHGLQVQLSPTDLMGADEKRLVTFYKRFGFVENKGENKKQEVSNTMYRDPLAEAIPNEETTDAKLDKKISAADKKIEALKDALRSARQEATMLQNEIKATYKDTLKSAREESTLNANEKAKQAERETRAKEQAKAKERLDRKINELNEKRRAAEKAKVDAKRLKEAKIKLAKKISKPSSNGINVRIRDKIENLQGLLDPKFTTKAGALAWEEEFKKIAKGYNDKNIENLVTHYGMKPRPLNLWTIDELTRLNDYIEGLRRDGRTYQDELDAQLRKHYREVREEYISRVLDGPPLPPIGTTEGSKARKSGVIKYVQFWTWRPSRIFRMLDDWTEGKFYDYFITEVNEKMDKSIAMTHERRARANNKLKELGLSVPKLSKKNTFGEYTFSRDEMIHIWLATQNPNSERALLKGNKIPPDIITLVENDLSADEKALGDYLLQDFSENYQRLANVYELYMNQHMGKEKAYFPMIRTGVWEKQDAEFWDQFKLRNEYRTSYTDRSFTQNRIQNKNAKQGGIRLGAFHIWNEQVEKHEHWIALGMHVKGMNGIVNRSQFKEPFSGKFGLQGYHFLTKYIEDVANPTLYKANVGASQVSRHLRKNAAIAYLSYNMLTMAKQIPSLALFMKEVGPLRILASAGKYVSGGTRWRDFVNQRDPQMLSRVVTKEIELIRRKEKNLYGRVMTGIGETGMKGITTFDSIVTHIGWLAIYDKYVNTLGEAEAIRRAQMTVLETQPSARAKDLAQMYKMGEGYNWMTMFSNQLNNIWNMTTADTTYMWKSQQYGKLMGIVAGVGISTISMMLLAGWRPGDDEEDFGTEFFKSGVNMVPFLGKAISAGMQGWGSSGMEVFPIGGEIGNAVREGLDMDGEALAKSIYDIALAAGVTAGIPTTGLIRRPVKAIQEENALEMLGPGFRED